MVCKVSGEVWETSPTVFAYGRCHPYGAKEIEATVFYTDARPYGAQDRKRVRFYKHIVPTGLRSEGWCVRYLARLGNLAYRVRLCWRLGMQIA